MFDWLKTNKRLREELANVRALNDRLRGELGEHQDECDDLEAENERLRRKLAAVGAVAVRCCRRAESTWAFMVISDDLRPKLTPRAGRVGAGEDSRSGESPRIQGACAPPRTDRGKASGQS